MIHKLKTEFIKTIKSGRLNVFLVFLVSSFIILIFTKLSKTYTSTVVFDIEKTGIPQDKIILSDSTHQLQLTLKTHGFKWLEYYVSPPKITIDFSRDVYVSKGAYIYTKSVSYLNEKKQFQNQIEILSKSPDTLAFRYDTNLVKRIPVISEASISYVPGYNSYEGLKITPDSVTVIGPHDIVSKFQKIQTKKIELKGIKSPIINKVKLILPESKNGLKFSVTEVELTANVEKFTEGSVNIPVRVIHIPKGITIKYFPKNLKISYYTSLKNFKLINADDFEITCDFKKAAPGQAFLVPELTRIPQNVKHVKVHQKQIEFIILK